VILASLPTKCGLDHFSSEMNLILLLLVFLIFSMHNELLFVCSYVNM